MKTIEELRNEFGDNVELRFVPGTEARAEDDGHVSGYGAVFNSWSPDYYGFRERIAPDAFRNVDMSDVVVTFNHNFDNLLARTSNGSATLSVDDHGLKYRYKTPNTTTGRDVQELVRDQTLAGSSFMFTVKDEQWEEKSDGTYDRTITEIGRLIELGPVTTPWYPQTDAQLKKRSMEIMERAGLKKEEEPEEQTTDETVEPEGKKYDPTVDLFILGLK